MAAHAPLARCQGRLVGKLWGASAALAILVAMAFIELNSRQCRACWKCVTECPQGVLHKVDFLWHRHAVVRRGDDCTGCLRCVRACDSNAITRCGDRHGSRAGRTGRTGRTGHAEAATARSMVHVGLLLSGALAAFSGLLIQMAYHRGHAGKPTAASVPVLGLGHAGWLDIHRGAILVLSALMALHVFAHWVTFEKMVRARFAIRDRSTAGLTIVFALAAITGYAPWLIGLLGGAATVRKAVVEIHDKLALILVVYLVLHVARRYSRIFHHAGA